jgi:hypothetical protein
MVCIPDQHSGLLLLVGVGRREGLHRLPSVEFGLLLLAGIG